MSDSAIRGARLIGFIGDVHGDMQHLLAAMNIMWNHGVQVLVVLGDFGMVWPGRNWSAELDKINRRLSVRGQTLYFIDGNHEDFDALYKFPLGDDGLRTLRQKVIHIPRGTRMTLSSGRTLAALGGANSIDADSRIAGRSWWPQESITDDDLASLGADPADVMIGHDAPLDLPALDRHLAATEHLWSESGLVYADAGRRVFHRGFTQVRPHLYLGGHYHLHVDQTVDFLAGEDRSRCRTVILDMNRGGDAVSFAIMDVEGLSLEYLTRRERPVTSLTGRESGRWHVTTAEGTHMLDLDARTIEQTPEANDGNPAPQLLELLLCRVGLPLSWTDTRRHDPTADHRQDASDVERIARVPRNSRSAPPHPVTSRTAPSRRAPSPAARDSPSAAAP
ncbi:metallophosphoesterase [Salinibacterium sp. GXW1014]|uniref:metallophosphoesterase family protein n=1 Tax=Salinibacterium sp. GXW1014 TaxID=3377838 RepID=UPI003839D825